MLKQYLKAPWSLMVLLCVCWVIPAHAHKQQVSTTHITVNAITGNLEVMHRFHSHDAEHYLNHLLKDHGDLMLNPKHQQLLGQYVAKHFKLSITEGGAPIDLTYVGQEVEGPYFWVYQQWPVNEVHTVWIEAGFFQDLWGEYSTEVYSQSGVEAKRYLLNRRQKSLRIPLVSQ
ncbi:DUF6702 family protein [Marinagarivorans algicola]|uniref:DUF6702 family protein n=1 Tax=Marinagarivorans algicola TaxID=1513270 RepID=UPI0006B907AD|nr:DUF6702 family protein [Marinagarivorans algicola]